MKRSEIKTIFINLFSEKKGREKSSKPASLQIPKYIYKPVYLRELENLLEELKEEDYPMSIPSKTNPYVWVLITLLKYDKKEWGRSFREIYECAKKILNKYVEWDYGGILNSIQPSVLGALEKRGLIESYGRCGRKKYRLTESGRKIADLLDKMMNMGLIFDIQ